MYRVAFIQLQVWQKRIFVSYIRLLGASRGHSINIGLRMKIKEWTLVLTILLMLTGCGSELYSKKELRTQTIPKELQNKIWTLREIYSEKILDASFTKEFNDSNGTENCSFTFQFADKGELLMNFKDYKFKGTYLVEGGRFKYLNCGYIMKIVWNISPECKITPTELAYVFGGEMQFRIDGQTLIIKSNTGNSFKLSATI